MIGLFRAEGDAIIIVVQSSMSMSTVVQLKLELWPLHGPDQEASSWLTAVLLLEL